MISDVKVLLSFDAREIVSRAQHLSFGVSRMAADQRLSKDVSKCDRYQFSVLVSFSAEQLLNTVFN